MNQKTNKFTGDFLKRQAKKIARQDNIPHHEALDRAALNAGFHNWNHYINSSKENCLSQLEARKLKIDPDAQENLILPAELNKINPYRNLLVGAINTLLDNSLISLNNEVSEQSDRGNGHFFVKLFGFPSVILWQEVGFGELRISVWWKYDHVLHPQANLTGNSRENFNISSPLADRSQYKKFVGVVASGWLERKTGKYLQGEGSKAIFDVYTRTGEKAEMQKIPFQRPKGFEVEGKFHF